MVGPVAMDVAERRLEALAVGEKRLMARRFRALQGLELLAHPCAVRTPLDRRSARSVPRAGAGGGDADRRCRSRRAVRGGGQFSSIARRSSPSGLRVAARSASQAICRSMRSRENRASASMLRPEKPTSRRRSSIGARSPAAGSLTGRRPVQGRAGGIGAGFARVSFKVFYFFLRAVDLFEPHLCTFLNRPCRPF